MNTIRHFHDECFLDLGSNVTFISLIPKHDQASKVSEFRPISMVESMYKILAKIVVGRLKVSLLEVISLKQSVFLDEGVLVANESMDEILKKGAFCVSWTWRKLTTG